MKKISLFLISLLCILFLAACEPVETGSIYISSPDLWPTIVRDDPLPFYTIILNSTYQDPKMLDIDNNGVSTTCLIESMAQQKSCPIPVSTPGDQNITIKVPLNDGTQITLQTSFKWLPYTPLDKQMQFGIFGTPIWGYLAVYLLTIIAIFLAFVLITGKNYELSSIIATLFSVAVIINAYFLPSLDQAVKAGYFIYPVFVIFLSLAIKLRYFYRPTLVIHEESGSEIRYIAKPPHRLAFRYLEISASDINKDLYLKRKEE